MIMDTLDKISDWILPLQTQEKGFAFCFLGETRFGVQYYLMGNKNNSLSTSWMQEISRIISKAEILELDNIQTQLNFLFENTNGLVITKVYYLKQTKEIDLQMYDGKKWHVNSFTPNTHAKTVSTWIKQILGA
mgnify:CR=1 FL=1